MKKKTESLKEVEKDNLWENKGENIHHFVQWNLERIFPPTCNKPALICFHDFYLSFDEFLNIFPRQGFVETRIN